MSIEMNKIGFVKNNIDAKSDADWGNIISEIVLKKEYSGGLKGLEEFSHAVIITYLHEAVYIKEKHLQRHPRNLSHMPLLGIFSQRGKNRPNPIGISSVKIVEIKKDTIIVKGLDAINGTPVLDIKPYFSIFDRVEKPEEPEWVSRLMKNYF